MKPSIFQKLQTLTERHAELSALLSDANVIAQTTQFRDLSKEYAQLEPLATAFKVYEDTQSAWQSANALLSDPEMKSIAQEEIETLQKQQALQEEALYRLLLPRDPDDTANVFLEVRAGTGGDEAAIFAGDLARMYMRYAERQGWQVEIISESHGEHGGYKEIIIRISGKEVYAQLKFESGAHRVQRVPVTESQGRVHTSACTIAVMPEVEDIESVTINPSDLKIDTYRASGAGGQHVNKTDSAIRITHIPTGVVVECQDERSQHKNRARAMSLLSSRLLMQEKEKQRATQASTRRELVGSGDRSERIRTYNYPQGRLTDHRINVTLYKLDDILNGDLTPVIEPLMREYNADLLAEMGRDDYQ